MPKRFAPCTTFDEYDQLFPWGAGMKESPAGEFVRLEAFNAERAQLLAQAERLKSEVRVLQAKLALPLEDRHCGTPVAAAAVLAKTFAAEAVQACLNDRPVDPAANEALYRGLAAISAQAMANTRALKTAREGWHHESADSDKLLEHLGLNPQDCRTDAGWVHLSRVRALLGPRSAAQRPPFEASTL